MHVWGGRDRGRLCTKMYSCVFTRMEVKNFNFAYLIPLSQKRVIKKLAKLIRSSNLS